MDEEQRRRSLLVTEYYDGAARALEFLDAHQLLVRYTRTFSETPLRMYEKSDSERTVTLLIDFEESRVLPAHAAAQFSHSGGLHDESTAGGLEAEVIRESERNGPAIEVRREARGSRRGTLVRRIERAGKRPLICLSPDGKALFSSSTDVLSRWDLATGRAQRFKCHDQVTHVALIGRLLAAQSRQGVISIFDAARRTSLVCVRPTLDGWIAFADDGAWDCSEGFTRGVELSRTDAKSTAFIPDEGFGWLENNHFPLTRVSPPRAGKCRGLIALRTAGFW